MTYLQILSWYFNFVKLLELEVAEPRTELLKVHLLWSLIQHFLKMISPLAKIPNISLQRQVLTIFREHKVGFESRLQLNGLLSGNYLNRFGQSTVREPFDINLCRLGKRNKSSHILSINRCLELRIIPRFRRSAGPQ
jgi:hypothetical protein